MTILVALVVSITKEHASAAGLKAYGVKNLVSRQVDQYTSQEEIGSKVSIFPCFTLHAPLSIPFPVLASSEIHSMGNRNSTFQSASLNEAVLACPLQSK